MSIRQMPATRIRKNLKTGEAVTSPIVRRWTVELRIAGEKHRKCFRTRREAEAYENNIRLQVAGGTYGVKQAQTVKDFASRFMEWSEQHNKKSTVAAKEKDLRVHLLPALGDLRLDAADLRAEVEAFTTKKLREGLTPKTVNNTLAVLQELLNLAAERGLVQYVPRLRKLRARAPEATFLDFGEAEKVLAATPPEWRTFVLVALRTGLRVGELLALRWTDVDFIHGQLRVRATRWRKHEDLPKGGRERVVPLTRDALAALKARRHFRAWQVWYGG